MKNLLIGSLCFLFLSVCQTYPKKPAQVSGWGKKMPVNRFVPAELKPYELPPKVQYIDTKQEVPKSIIVKK